LARAAGVFPATVARFEQGNQSTFPMRAKLGAGLQRAGVVFTNGDETGVKLRSGKES
jgi:hypothetical protein